MKRIFLVSAIILFGLLSVYISTLPKQNPFTHVEITKEATATAVLESESTARVTHIVDGDTVEIEGGKRVRYIGINTPEIGYNDKPDECFAKEARAENSRLVQGRIIRLVRDISDTDTYGRLLRYVYIGNSFINDELVKQGFAQAEPIPPDTRSAGTFFTSQNLAKAGSRGLWSVCSFR